MTQDEIDEKLEELTCSCCGNETCCVSCSFIEMSTGNLVGMCHDCGQEMNWENLEGEMMTNQDKEAIYND